MATDKPPPQASTARRQRSPAPAPGGQRIRLVLLDGFALLRDGTPVTVPRGLQRIIALIGLRPGATRSHLAGLLWPNTAEDRALSSLRTALWRLRQEALCPVHTPGDTVRLDPAVGLDVDDLVDAAARIRDGADPQWAHGVLTTGRYDLLPGWYDDWVLLERERLRQLRLHMLEEVARMHLRAGRHGEALQAALEAVGTEPLRETPHRLMVEIHRAEGNAYEALHTFYVYRDLIRRELQLEPSPAMRGLVDDILGPIGQQAGPPPAGAARDRRPDIPGR